MSMPPTGAVPPLDHAAILDALPDALLFVTADGKIVRAFGSTAQLVGFDPAPLAGSSLFDHVHPEDLASVQLPWRVHARRPGSRASFRWRLLHQQGTWRDVDVASHHVATAERRPGTILLSLRDVTGQLREARLESNHRQRLEEELSQLRAAIGTMEEATAWAQQMAGRAIMESVARGGQLARMSHEIRTPLNGILGTLDLLVDLDLTQEQRDLVQTSLRAGEAMLDLVNEILDFARLEADTIELESIPFDPREVVEEAVAVFAGRTEAKGLELGVDAGASLVALEEFEGVGRRFETRGEAGGVLLIDDYGHHPTEMAAVFATAREAHPDRRLVVVFQPHRFTRTRSLAREFAEVLKDVDLLVLADVYPAGERPIPGVSSDLILDALRLLSDREVVRVHGRDDAPVAVAGLLRPGDLVVTLGAGDVSRWGDAILARLEPGAAEGIAGGAGARLPGRDA